MIGTLDRSLPHNPRKLKAFVSTWKLYLRLLVQQPRAEGASLDWRLTIILNYLGQFEEPLFRKIEEAPGFYSDQVVRFCRDGTSTHPLFDGLELPYQATMAIEETTGGLESVPPLAAPPDPNEAPKLFPSSRVFWISRLVNELANAKVFVNETIIRQHLLRTGGVLSQPLP